MEERVHPIPFRTRKLSSPSPMILHNVMWESRPLSTIAPKPLAATSARGFVVYPPLRILPPSRPSRLPTSLPLPQSHLGRGLSSSPFCFTASLCPKSLEPHRLQFCQSLSAAFTQTRLLHPECVSAVILMLTYLSTLRSKSRRFLFRSQNAYFANSSNTSTSPPPPLGESKEGNATTLT